jgi:hypothetical protein
LCVIHETDFIPRIETETLLSKEKNALLLQGRRLQTDKSPVPSPYSSSEGYDRQLILSEHSYKPTAVNTFLSCEPS